jgi:GNAT superfamily N-acetyltransferase
MIFANRELAQRLERAEGFACVQFAAARKRIFPECDSAWIRCAGADVVFDGVDAPTTQTFGLGMFEEPTAENLEEIERFFTERGAATMHEVSPMAGVAMAELLCARGYRPIEISSVLYRTVEMPEGRERDGIQVRVVGADEAELWAAVSARGWTHEYPELREFVEQMGALMVAREQSPCFLAELNGVAGAAGGLSLHEGVALFAGAATAPEMRRKGLQGALLEARMRYAFERGCDLAMMVTEAGSESQRNAERQGFRVAYTRMKWKKDAVRMDALREADPSPHLPQTRGFSG